MGISLNKENKFYLWFTYVSKSGFVYYDYGGRSTISCASTSLCTNTKEKAIYIAKTFIDIYRQYLGN